MSAAFSTPRQALAAMVAAGASFKIRPRADSLPSTFTFAVLPGGDLAECRRILAAVKNKPRQFGEAFRIAVAEIAQRVPS